MKKMGVKYPAQPVKIGPEGEDFLTREQIAALNPRIDCAFLFGIKKDGRGIVTQRFTRGDNKVALPTILGALFMACIDMAKFVDLRSGYGIPPQLLSAAGCVMKYQVVQGGPGKKPNGLSRPTIRRATKKGAK